LSKASLSYDKSELTAPLYPGILSRIKSCHAAASPFYCA
jgi:hypothetical protein